MLIKECKVINIGQYQISKNMYPFIVAEAGINHNGELDKALMMIESAKKAGVNAIKFQTFKAKEFCNDAKQLFSYQSQGKTITEPMLNMFKRYELNREEWFLIKQKCDDEGILFLSTPQNRSDLNLLIEIGISAIKVGSDDFTNLPLLRDYATTGLPMVVSCGMADFDEINQALGAIGAFVGYPTILLLCTSQYPTPAKDVNLLKLRSLAEHFPNLLLGFSDHTQGYLAAALAVGFGAVFFEKHFTLDNYLPGPDHWFSENPENLAIWVEHIHQAYQMMGSATIRPTEAELEMRLVARRSIVVLKDIKKGEKFTEENIGLRRPGNGLPPAMLQNVLGCFAKRNLIKSTLLTSTDVNQTI